MKKAIITGALILAVLFVTIVPVFAETVNASDMENMANISPIIYILQNNGFTVNYDDAFSDYNGTDHGVFTFTGNIETDYVYQSSMTLKTFIENYGVHNNNRTILTTYYWLNIESDNLTVNLWANNRMLTLETLFSMETTLTGDEVLGISFSNLPANNTNSTPHELYNITVLKYEAETTDGYHITNDLTTQNWPVSKDYYRGYIFTDPGKKPQYYFNAETFNLFKQADSITLVAYLDNGVNTREVRHTLDNPQYTEQGIKFNDALTWLRDNYPGYETNEDYYCYCFIEFEYTSYKWNWSAIPIYRNGLSSVNTMFVYKENDAHQYQSNTEVTENPTSVQQFILQNELPTFPYQITYPVIVRQLKLEVMDPFNSLDKIELTIKNQQYQNGYNDGRNIGYTEGKEAGIKEGQEQGRQIGYQEGYAERVEQANTTFYDLMFAVVDAPVQVFGSMFNFEILGVNMRGFLLGLLTLAIFVIIIKKVVL